MFKVLYVNNSQVIPVMSFMDFGDEEIQKKATPYQVLFPVPRANPLTAWDQLDFLISQR